MNITFYTFAKRVNSTARPTSGGAAYAVTIKDGSSAINPAISLKWSGIGSPVAYNYAYCAAWGRYYWVNNWTYYDRQWTADLHVDVLATYKTQIGASSQYVTRAASLYDNSIVDGLYPTKAEPWNYSGHAQIWNATAIAPADMVYTVSLMGPQGFQQYYLMSGAALAWFSLKVFDSSDWSSLFDFGILSDDTIKSIVGPEDYIVSIKWLPLQWSDVNTIGDETATITLGYLFNVNFGSLTTKPRVITNRNIKTLNTAISLNTHPDATIRGGYLNGNTYTSRTLYVPSLGTIPLDSDKMFLCTKVHIETRINLASGSATFILTARNDDLSRNATLGLYESTVAVDVGYGTTRFDAAGLASSIMGTVAAGLTGNAVGAMSGIVNAVQSATPRMQILSKSGSIGTYQTDAYLMEQFYRPVDEDLADRGRPLCRVVQISTLSGYVKTEDATLQLAATENELSSVLSYLNGGFFYE